MRWLRRLVSLMVLAVAAMIVWNAWRQRTRRTRPVVGSRPRPSEFGLGDRGAAGRGMGVTAAPAAETTPVTIAQPEVSGVTTEPELIAPEAAVAQRAEEPTGESSETTTPVVSSTPRPAPAGAVAGDGSHECPPDHPIKGNANSKIYHRPGLPSYERTIPEFCFATTEAAAAAGFRAPKRG